jgi:two-component system response regulator NreC
MPKDCRFRTHPAPPDLHDAGSVVTTVAGAQKPVAFYASRALFDAIESDNAFWRKWVGIRVLIADDHGLLRAGLRALLSAESDLTVVGEAADGGQAVALAEQLLPDIVLADISMPIANGIEVAQELRKRSLNVQVVIVTMHEDAVLLSEALAAGARGYIVKRAVEAELIAVVRMVARGELYIHPYLGRSAQNDPAQVTEAVSTSPAAALTPDEERLLHMVAAGCTRQDMAAELGVEPSQVALRQASLMQKLGVHGRIGLVRYAQDHHLVH